MPAVSRSRSVAIVGASTNPERYSHQAVLRYLAKGWTVWPVHPSGLAVAGQACFRTLSDLPGRPDIVCMYVAPATGLGMLDAIVAVKPQVLWLNPGADGEPLVSAARARGLHVTEGCTLVVLGHGDPLTFALARG